MLSKDHPSILSSLLHVASIQKRRDIYEEAEETYRQALELMKEVQGNMHADCGFVAFQHGRLRA